MPQVEDLLQDAWEGYGTDAPDLPTSENAPQALYKCPVCGEEYSTWEECFQCVTGPVDLKGVSIGDIFIVPFHRAERNTYDEVKEGWDEWKHWVAFTEPADPESSSHFDHVPRHHPFYVVTAITTEKNSHRLICHLFTLVGGSLAGGWNPLDCDGHSMTLRPGILVTENTHFNHDLFVSDRPFVRQVEECQVPERVREEANQLVEKKLWTHNLI